MSKREKDQADFDLEAFIDLFDEALTSDDPSVQKTLQHLMVIAALARNHNKHDQRNGPLRRLYEDINHLHRRVERMEDQLQRAERSQLPPQPYDPYNYPWEKYSMQSAAAMAAKIDQDVLDKIKTQHVATAKGLLDK